MKRIYLMGMKHTGKSVHGKAIAAALGRKFCDTDALIQELDSTETGMRRTVRDIYIEDGAERFHRLEIAACRLVTERESRLVVATGGGLCDNPEALSTTEGSLRVHLVDSLQSIASRIFRRGIPAFLHTSDEAVARRRFRALYDRRTVAYDETADIRVDLTDLSIQEAQSRIINAIEEYQRAGK
ncbi:MAG: shikimate kinase [Spirochaetota bacterium]